MDPDIRTESQILEHLHQGWLLYLFPDCRAFVLRTWGIRRPVPYMLACELRHRGVIVAKTAYAWQARR